MAPAILADGTYGTNRTCGTFEAIVVEDCTMSFVRALFALLMAATPLIAAPKKLLLVGQGPDGHPPSTHE